MILKEEEQLRQVSKHVDFKKGKETAKFLIEELQSSHNGVGLAAPQVGIFERVVVIQKGEYFLSLINPKVIELRDPFINMGEGCLSFPGVWLNTVRYREIVVEDDNNGRMTLKHFPAIIAHHELDHLDGVLFMDREVPKNYEECFCDSGKKFKFCHREQLM